MTFGINYLNLPFRIAQDIFVLHSVQDFLHLVLLLLISEVTMII